MTIIIILTLSVLMQFAAAFMAFRLIPLTGKRLAWSLIATALMFMALRRCVTLFRMFSGDTTFRPDLTAELIALVISLLIVVGISGIAPIFTERKRAETMLRESEEKYRLIFDNAPLGIMHFNEKGIITSCNDQFVEIIGSSREVLVGRNMLDMQDKHVVAAVKLALNGKLGYYDDEYHSVTASKITPVHALFAPIASETGEIVGGVGIVLDVTERKQAEKALKQSEEKYRHVADFTYAWEYWLAPNGKYIYVSPACERISGYRIEEFLQDSKLLEKITHPDDRHRLAVHIQDVLQGKSGACQLEFRIVTKNSEVRWIGHECQWVYGHDGAYLGRRGSNRDITDRKYAEEVLNEKDKFLDSIIQSSAVATFVVNAEHKVIYWNRACEDLTGMKSENLLDTSDHWKAFYDHRRPCVADIIIDSAFNEMTDLYKVYAKSVLIPDGIRAEGWYPNLGGKKRYVVFDAAPIRDDNGKITAAIETLQDLTERRQAEVAQQEGQRQLKAILDNIPDIAWLKDKESRFIAVNEPFGRSCGFEPEDLVGKTDLDIWSKDLAERYRADDKEVMESGKRKQVEEPMQGSEGQSLWIETIKTPIHDNQGNVAGTAGIARDITERKKTEETLKETLENLRKALGTTIQVMVSAIEVRDPYTAGHQIRSAGLARSIATEMGLSQDTIEAIRMAGPIHDIGKLSVPAEILSKPTKLTNIEFSLIKEHARTGFEMLKDVKSPWPLAEIVYQHHERMDGSGYPRNLKGDDILVEARIMAVADVVESMASHRPYRPALGLNAALAEIENNKGTLYDADAVDTCLKLFREKGYRLEGA
jgi:PAS domain S-box-containing protein